MKHKAPHLSPPSTPPLPPPQPRKLSIVYGPAETAEFYSCILPDDLLVEIIAEKLQVGFSLMSLQHFLSAREEFESNGGIFQIFKFQIYVNSNS